MHNQANITEKRLHELQHEMDKSIKKCKITVGFRGCREDGDWRGSGVLSEDGDLVGVSAEVLDVLLDPFEDQDLIQDTHVARGGLVVSCQEAQSSETIVEGDKDDVLNKTSTNV